MLTMEQAAAFLGHTNKDGTINPAFVSGWKAANLAASQLTQAAKPSGTMTTHELARHLLAFADMPVTAHVNNHSLSSTDMVKLTIATRYGVEHMVIGNLHMGRYNGEWSNHMRVAV